MRIGLINVDDFANKRKKGGVQYPNLALAKLAAWHKQRGDEVSWYDPLAPRYDIVYMAKIFSFSSDYLYPINADKIIKGGTGYNLYSRLPQEVDDCQPDLTIFPDVPQDTAYGFLTRGCPNHCPWCVVPRKEGKIHPYWDVDRVANGKSKLVLMDNNILAAGQYCLSQLDKIIDRGYRIDFNQALDARLVTDEIADRLVRIKWIHSRIRFGCDTTPQIAQCQRAIDMLHDRGFRGEFFLYTMIGGRNDLHECYGRISYWWKKNQLHKATRQGNAVYCYAQPYRDPDNPQSTIPQWQRDMAGWCNKRMVYCATDFIDFMPRKNFKCKNYIL